MKPPDAGKDLFEKHDDLRQAIVGYNTVKKRGDNPLDSGATPFSYLTYFSVVSKESRYHCLKLAEKVTKEFKYDIE